MKLTYEITITTLVFLIICAVYSGQKRATLNNGQGYDGVWYYKISEQISNGTYPVVGEKPFIKRVGTFFLIGNYSRLTGLDLLDSALHVNLVGYFIATILLMFWLRIFIDVFWIRQILLLLFMMAWFAPLRYTFFLPMASDAWGAVWFMGGLLLLKIIRKLHDDDRNILWYVISFSMVVALGNLFREANAVLALALFFVMNPLKCLNISSDTMSISHGIKFINQIRKLYFVKKSAVLLLPILTIFLVNFIVSNYVIMINDQYVYHGYFLEALRWSFNKSFPTYLVSIFNTYGPLILLTPYFYKQFQPFFMKNQELLFLLICSFILGFIGGADTERIVFMLGFPFVFVLIGLSIKSVFNSMQRWWLYILFFLQTIAYRFYWNFHDIPNDVDYPIPFFTIMRTEFQTRFLLAQHGSNVINSILLIEYILLSLATLYILHNRVTLKDFK